MVIFNEQSTFGIYGCKPFFALMDNEQYDSKVEYYLPQWAVILTPWSNLLPQWENTVNDLP